MINLLIILCSLFVAVPLYANPCMQMLMGGTTGTGEAPPAACDTQTTPSDMETSDYTYTVVADNAVSTYVASQFTADATTGTVCKICLNLNKVGSPTMNFSVQVWGSQVGGDYAGDPDSTNVKGTYGSMNAGSIAGSFGDCFDDASVEYTNGTTYWIVLVADAVSSSNYFRWVRDATCTTENIKRSTAGTSANWAVVLNTKCTMVKMYKVGE